MKYYFSPKIKWRTFKKLYDAIPDSGPTPTYLSKILWELLKEKRIYIEYSEKDLFVSVIPPKGKIKIIH